MAANPMGSAGTPRGALLDSFRDAVSTLESWEATAAKSAADTQAVAEAKAEAEMKMAMEAAAAAKKANALKEEEMRLAMVAKAAAEKRTFEAAEAAAAAGLQR